MPLTACTDESDAEKVYNTLAAYFDDVSDIKTISPEREIELGKLLERGGRKAKAAREEFVKANLRLSVYVAKKFKSSGEKLGYSFADLIQEGNIGLVKAVDLFDYRKGFRFSTYATWWVRHCIIRALQDKAAMVRVPVHLQDSIRKVDNAIQRLSPQLQRVPTDEELCSATKLSLETIKKVRLQIPRSLLSLNNAIDSDDDREFISFLKQPDGDNFVDKPDNDQQIETVLNALDKIDPKYANVLKKRFGIGTTAQTLLEIGIEYNLSRERIRQIQEIALSMLRKQFTGKSKLPKDMMVKTMIDRSQRPSKVSKKETKQMGRGPYVRIKDLSELAHDIIDDGISNGLSAAEVHKKLVASNISPLPCVSSLRDHMNKLSTQRSSPPSPIPFTKQAECKALIVRPPGNRYVVRLDGSIETYDAESALALAQLIQQQDRE